MSTSRAELRLAWIPACVLLLSVFAAEWAYRLLGVRVSATMTGIYEPFGDHSFKHRPGAQAFMNWFSGPFTVATDALGLRVASPGAAAAPRPDLDVLVAGDSQAFGQGVEFDDSVIGAFQKQASAVGLTVANAAVAGHGLRNQVEVVRWLIEQKGVRPKVLMFCLTSKGLAYPTTYSHAFVRDGTLFGEEPGPRQLARSWLSTHSAAWVIFRNAVRDRSASGESDFFQIYDSSRHAERMKELSSTFAGLQALLAPINARLVLVFMPLVAELKVEDLARSSGKAGANLSAREPFRLAEDLSTQFAAPLADLTPVLRRASDAKEPLNLLGEDHYSQSLSKACGRQLFTAFDWKHLTTRGNNP